MKSATRWYNGLSRKRKRHIKRQWENTPHYYSDGNLFYYMSKWQAFGRINLIV